MSITEFLHFCWRPRSASVDKPDLDLLMMPADGHLTEYTTEYKGGELGRHTNGRSPTNGRIIVLKFASSSQRYAFWLQSKSQSSSEDPSVFSNKDIYIIKSVNIALSDQDLDLTGEGQGHNDIEPDAVNNVGELSLSERNENSNRSENRDVDRTDAHEGDSAGREG